jgi:hypothetical protein
VSRLTELIAKAKAQDPQFGADLEREFRALSSRLSFDLNFERHRPEAVELTQRPVRRGDKVRILPPRGSTARGLQFSQVLVRLSQDRDVELLLGDQPLEPSVLDLELLQPPRLLRLHAAVLVAPAVEGVLAHAEVLQHLRHRAARREHGVGLAKLVDDLFRCVSCPFHRESPGPSRGWSGLS